MPKKRVHEIAKEQGLTSKQVLEAFKDAGVYVKAASSTVEEREGRRGFPKGRPKKGAGRAPRVPNRCAKEGRRAAEGREEGRREGRRPGSGRRGTSRRADRGRQ